MTPQRFSVVAALALTMVVSLASAHELRPGYLSISEVAPTQYEIVWKAPLQTGRPLAVQPRFPGDCRATASSIAIDAANAVVNRSTLSCDVSLHGQQIELAGLDATVSDVLVRFRTLDGRTQSAHAIPDHPAVEFDAESTQGGVGRTYFFLGVEHILDGLDHLLFVLALVLLITGFRRLVATITAFTLAHSLTLAGATLGWTNLPTAPVEAVIALSIVFLANEIACKTANRPRLSQRKPWLVAFAFGLLHGFGFSSALTKIGLPQDEIPLALLTFNLGVEAGQLIFLSGILLLLGIVERLRWRKPVEVIASYAIGAVSCAWLFERVV